MKHFPTSIETILHQTLKNKNVFSINPLIDFYNTLSLQHIYPTNTFDLDTLNQSLTLHMTTKNKHFTTLDTTEPISVPTNEITYTNNTNVLTHHFMWHQSQLKLITPHNTQIFLISEIPKTTNKTITETIHKSMTTKLHNLFNIPYQNFIMNTNQTNLY